MRFPKKILSLVIVLAAVLAASCGGGRPAERVKVLLTPLDGRPVFRDSSFRMQN